MEGTAFLIRNKIEELAAAGIPANRIAMVGGASESSTWAQIVADVTGLEIQLRHCQVAGAVGAAILAGIGAGIYKNEREALRQTQGKEVFVKPGTDASRQYDQIFAGQVGSSTRAQRS